MNLQQIQITVTFGQGNEFVIFFIWAGSMTINMFRALESLKSRPIKYLWCDSFVQPTMYFINVIYLMSFALSVASASFSYLQFPNNTFMVCMTELVVNLAMTVTLTTRIVRELGKRPICCIMWLQPPVIILLSIHFTKADAIAALKPQISLLFWSVCLVLIIFLSSGTSTSKSFFFSKGMLCRYK